MRLYFKVLQQAHISLYTDTLHLPKLRLIPFWSWIMYVIKYIFME